jgi:hypothetical protein
MLCVSQVIAGQSIGCWALCFSGYRWAEHWLSLPARLICPPLRISAVYRLLYVRLKFRHIDPFVCGAELSAMACCCKVDSFVGPK